MSLRVISTRFTLTEYARRNREQCTRLLSLLIPATPRLIKPYALTMLRALLPKAEDPHPAVAANILACLGELSAVGGEDFLPHVPELMKAIGYSLKLEELRVQFKGQKSSYRLSPPQGQHSPVTLPHLCSLTLLDAPSVVRKEIRRSINAPEGFQYHALDGYK